MVIVAHAVPALAAKAVRKIKALLSRCLERIAEQQIRKARFEIEMYRGMYRHSSKNDDDLPIVR